MKRTSRPSEPTGDGPTDWERFLREHGAAGLPAIEPATLRAGDRLVAESQHLRDGIGWRAGCTVLLAASRPARAGGVVRTQGCTFGASSTIKAGIQFCGDSLGYLSDDGRMRHTTTAIRSLVLLRLSG